MKKKRIHKNRKSYKSIDFYYLQSNSSSHIFYLFMIKHIPSVQYFFTSILFFNLLYFFFSSKNSIYMILNINFFDMNIVNFIYR